MEVKHVLESRGHIEHVASNCVHHTLREKWGIRWRPVLIPSDWAELKEDSSGILVLPDPLHICLFPLLPILTPHYNMYSQCIIHSHTVRWYF